MENVGQRIIRHKKESPKLTKDLKHYVIAAETKTIVQ